MTIWIQTIQNQGGPAYQSLADAIEQAIRKGELEPGQRLPTHRELADQLGLNVSTITRGYREAENRGLIAGTVGRGTFVTSDAAIASHMVAVGPHQSLGGIEMGLISPLYHLEPDLALALRRMAARSRPDLYLRYSDPAGLPAHRQIGAAWAARYGLQSSGRDVIICAGAQHALTCILTGMFRAGDRIAADCLSYPGIKTLAAMLGLRLVPIAMDDRGMLPEALDAACRREKIKGLYLIPGTHNPTTLAMPEARRDAVAELIGRHGLLLIEDDAYDLTSAGRHQPVAARVPQQGCYVAGVSKILAAGLRVAFVVAPRAMCKPLAQAVLNTVWMAPPLNVALIAAWIEDGTADRVLAAKKAAARERQKAAAEQLAGLNFAARQAGYFLWLQLPPPWTGQMFETRARERGLKLFAAERFTIGQAPAPAAVRISVTGPATLNELRNGLAIVRDLIENEVTVQGPFL